MINKFKKTIETSFEKKEHLKKCVDPLLKNTIISIINLLDKGKIRVAEKKNGTWITNQWIKKSILIYFCIFKNKLIISENMNFFDKISMKFEKWDHDDFCKHKIRAVPCSFVRKGSFIAKNSVIMPSYINIGAYIGENSTIDTWSTIGSCAQIGKNVHISGGVGIGGVLEPVQNNPTIIEDNCFIGARSEIVEGVVVESGSVISMGVFIGKSTKIYDSINNKIYYGRIPKKSVVIPGSLPSKNNRFNINCAIIIKKPDHETKRKIKMNSILHLNN
ncbi:dapD [Wigglesworthia glossinidia endosymbiont of Glossina brevipalpis]|uniref:2,3,4,5-tetrahydropyridine-2,6-dicarboxylate N-succinyltransferase n=1 Tax=Wigglesworthia glossinidia brevipalpis TaxID=36870 RepID=DAPD_WIGBR|nr:RecName: Full=2,3,4,5-tetrahydropyridine-2,6-dicarboxylate N-succinyltransferase; AltName: Full=Tetrahydrodipicolinate N-succinyltransferase; Short=THDP succinyltransferase; Short=THP succinyltransferase; Short=Tetrahydropicolinate succinylase [Wigglesworthia glossinidia endosymbiont of Glossina brevipalpis]BAC24540.1 dapD [Wigglesworthia glossinidia endosymbiont of Glossina brevipalpis]